MKNKDKGFWEFIKNYDYICLGETWIEEKSWIYLKGRLTKTHNWVCNFARKEKRKAGQRKG